MPESFLSPGTPQTLLDPRLPQSTEREVLVPDDQLVAFVVDQRKRLHNARSSKRAIWDECWQLYRGQMDFSDKEEWQSKIVMPDAFSVVKQGVNAIKRLLQTSEQPWVLEPHNPDDEVAWQRGEKLAKVLKFFLGKEENLLAFVEGLESGFTIGLGAWKQWWAIGERERIRARIVPPGDPREAFQRQVVRETIAEGSLRMQAVDPYNFVWLPGSRFNRWTGTIEDMEVPAWQLFELGEEGVLDVEAVSRAVKSGKRIDSTQERRGLRFQESRQPQGASVGMQMVKLSEYYGPLLDERGRVVEKFGHLIVAGDSTLLLKQVNRKLRRAPYTAWSPLLIPFRDEGVGVVEMSRALIKGLNKLINMSMDGQTFRLLPMFDMVSGVYENEEELDAGITPGKVLKRGIEAAGLEGLRPVPSEDISAGAVQLEGVLDRGIQKGSFMTEILQALPRFRGAQTLGEIQEKAGQQENFLDVLARDVDNYAVQPMVELAVDLVLLNLDTSLDERIGSLLGVGADVLRGMSQAEVLELVHGDYIVRAEGVSSQVHKAETLGALIQFMNIMGQNPEAWLPFVRQDELLRRILEAFRPQIRDIENIIADPATVEAQRHALAQSQLTPELLRLMPQIIALASQFERDKAVQAN